MESSPQPRARAQREHSRRQAAAFAAKAWIFRVRRMAVDVARGRPRRLERADSPGESAVSWPVVAESRSRLFTGDSAAEFLLQAGKVENLRVAASRLDGLAIPEGGVFSFWRNLPRPTRRHGFVRGRELREGCLIPSVGGGLCQLSNALYDAALAAGCEIVERHAHSMRVPGSMAAEGRDATVFWNYVDLRFRAATALRLDVRLSRTELIVRLRGRSPDTTAAGEAPPPSSSRAPEAATVRGVGGIGACDTCGVSSCFRHLEPCGASATTAWLVDAWWPEFDDWMRARREPTDWLLVPLDGARFGIGRYRWSSEGFGRVRQAVPEVVRRSLVSRRLAAQGAARQRALLRMDAAMAARYRRSIPPEATRVVVSQNLLPFLWRAGVLGGRGFEVLMTRLPLAELSAALDRAAARHPESPTLADFRADPVVAADEAEALAAADHWITPHDVIARLAGQRAVRLDWKVPSSPRTTAGGPGAPIVFPASTVGRKGAYELREAARVLGLRVRLGGPVLEGPGFWDGIETEPPSGDLLDGAGAVVLPAWVEHQPRRLLEAVAAGIPVIASAACGLEGMPGVRTIAPGETGALVRSLRGLADEACSGPRDSRPVTC